MLSTSSIASRYRPLADREHQHRDRLLVLLREMVVYLRRIRCPSTVDNLLMSLDLNSKFHMLHLLGPPERYVEHLHSASRVTTTKAHPSLSSVLRRSIPAQSLPFRHVPMRSDLSHLEIVHQLPIFALQTFQSDRKRHPLKSALTGEMSMIRLRVFPHEPILFQTLLRCRPTHLEHLCNMTDLIVQICHLPRG